MDTWMKCVWALAALTIVVALVALSQAPGGRGTTMSASSTPEYFVQQDRDRSVTEYGVRENGRAVIYSSRLAK